jgi:hypothetical protein
MASWVSFGGIVSTSGSATSNRSPAQPGGQHAWIALRDDRLTLSAATKGLSIGSADSCPPPPWPGATLGHSRGESGNPVHRRRAPAPSARQPKGPPPCATPAGGFASSVPAVLSRRACGSFRGLTNGAALPCPSCGGLEGVCHRDPGATSPARPTTSAPRPWRAEHR